MILLLFLAAAAAPATAGNDAQSRHELMVMGDCVADTATWAARDVLATDYRTPEYQKKLHNLGSGLAGSCLRYRSTLRSAGVLFVGALAEGMLHREYKRNQLPQLIAYDAARPAIVARSEGEAMALCTAMKAPQATADLLQSGPSSPAEDRQIAALTPVLGQCLQQGAQAEMNKPAIRAMLALAAWRIASLKKAAS